MAALDDDLVGHPVGVGEPVDAVGIKARDARRRAEQQPRRRARGHVPGLGAGRRRDLAPGDLLELVDREVAPGGVGHRGDHLGVHPLAADPGGGADGVDDGAQTELVNDVHLPTIRPT